MSDLKDWTFDELINFAVTQIIESVFGGSKTLRGTLHWVLDVASRWGAENERARVAKLAEGSGKGHQKRGKRAKRRER